MTCIGGLCCAVLASSCCSGYLACWLLHGCDQLLQVPFMCRPVPIQVVKTVQHPPPEVCFALCMQTVSIPFFTETWRPTSFYARIKNNLAAGLHTLCLLDIKVREPTLESLARGKPVRAGRQSRSQVVNTRLEGIKGLSCCCCLVRASSCLKRLLRTSNFLNYYTTPHHLRWVRLHLLLQVCASLEIYRLDCKLSLDRHGHYQVSTV